MSVLSIAAYVMSGLLIVIVNKCPKTQLEAGGGSGDFITSAIIWAIRNTPFDGVLQGVLSYLGIGDYTTHIIDHPQ